VNPVVHTKLRDKLIPYGSAGTFRIIPLRPKVQDHGNQRAVPIPQQSEGLVSTKSEISTVPSPKLPASSSKLAVVGEPNIVPSPMLEGVIQVLSYSSKSEYSMIKQQTTTTKPEAKSSTRLSPDGLRVKSLSTKPETSAVPRPTAFGRGSLVNKKHYLE